MQHIAQKFYQINTTTTNEYFLIENRQKQGFDTYIPGNGMIIYHVHSGVNQVGNKINATHPQRMYPVCASATMDPTSNPSSYGNINSQGCLGPIVKKLHLLTRLSQALNLGLATIQTNQ